MSFDFIEYVLANQWDESCSTWPKCSVHVHDNMHCQNVTPASVLQVMCTISIPHVAHTNYGVIQHACQTYHCYYCTHLCYQLWNAIRIWGLNGLCGVQGWGSELWLMHIDVVIFGKHSATSKTTHVLIATWARYECSRNFPLQCSEFKSHSSPVQCLQISKYHVQSCENDLHAECAQCFTQNFLLRGEKSIISNIVCEVYCP